MPGTRPIYFGPADRRLFGWLHPAAREAPAGVGLVLVSPFGYEAVCAHRSLRHFAEAAAAAGIPALRFDRDGTGDSAGGDRDPDRLGAWVSSVHKAIDELRSVTSVQRVFVLGVRLGATLAALAAAGREDVAGLIAIAPVVSGRAYSRELRALQMALNLAPPPSGVAPTSEEEQEALGFLLTAETRAALGKLELAKLERRAAADVLILDRADLPTAAKWADHLTSQGASVDNRKLPGYVEMVLDPHNAVVPAEMLGAAVDWMKARAAPPAEGAKAPPIEAAPVSERAPASAAAHPVEATFEGGVIEIPTLVDQRVRLFGVLTTPPRGVKPLRSSVLLLNAGSVHHIGPNRLYVPLARRLAAEGYTVLRMDLAGLGDSRARPGHSENIPYSDAAMDDVLAGVAHLSLRTGGAPCTVCGLCSGAYHAFKAGVKGFPIARAVAINPLTFFWKPGMSLDVANTHQMVAESSRVMESAASAAAWKKVLSGKVNLRSAARVVGLRAVAEVESLGRRVARKAGMRLEDDLPSDLLAIARGGIDLRFVFAANDPGLPMLKMLGGSTVRELVDRGKLHIETIAGPDHTFTQVWSHELLLHALVAQLNAPLSR